MEKSNRASDGKELKIPIHQNEESDKIKLVDGQARLHYPQKAQWPRREGTPLKTRTIHNRQKTGKRFIDKKKRKGLRDLITPKVIYRWVTRVIYYFVARPIIDLVIAWMQSNGLL